jgi:crotonobetainyl-CoA:carnitine CoA-transferase CaiB-like acyl-CoA transferase
MKMKVELGGNPEGPLSGIHVVDFSTVVSGPLCAQILGDLGADVIKVETPRGDTTRMMGPFRGALGAVFSQVNRNKRSVTVDLKKPEGLEVAQRLAKRADIVIENFRPGVMERLGIGYETLAAANPGLVYVAISGFGPEGPYSTLPAYDTVIQGLSGFMQIQGEADDPKLVRGIAADKTSGLTAAYAAIAALFARERNGGRGQRVDIPMLDAYAAFALPDSLAEEAFVPVEERAPGAMRIQDVHRTWKTADGHVVMMIIEDSQFHGICRAVDRTDLIDDPRCENFIVRLTHMVELFEILAEEVAKWPTAELVERARRFGAPLAPAHSIREFIEDPQTQANGTIFEVEHESEGTLRQLRNPARFSQTPTSLRRLPPLASEHTDEVLRELGYDDEQIGKMREQNSIV